MVVTDEFHAWLAQVAPRDAHDPGIPVAGADEWLRAMFERRGPISAEELDLEATEVAMQLARDAVERFLRDLHATTDERPLIEIRQDDEYGVIVSYDGEYTTPAFLAMRDPEATCELADYLQTEVHRAIGRTWPTCHEHGAGLHAATDGVQAIWSCHARGHQVAIIGELAGS